MNKGQRPPASKASPKTRLASASTSPTSSESNSLFDSERIDSGPSDTASSRTPRKRATKGVEVAAPSKDLLGTNQTDWSTIGKWILSGFAIGAPLIALIWHYANTSVSVTRLIEDVNQLRQRSDDALKTSFSFDSRITSLERKQAESQLPVPSTTSAPASASKTPN